MTTKPRDRTDRFYRAATLDAVALRQSADGDGSIGFTGHAAVFDERTLIGTEQFGFWEEIAPGAFRKTLKEADVRFLVNHNPDAVLARNRAGTLRLAEDDVGLSVDADLAPTQTGRDLATLLERGDVTQMSFAFRVVKEDVVGSEDDLPVFRVGEVELFDVSAVTYPAYESTDAALRARMAGHETIEPQQQSTTAATWRILSEQRRRHLRLLKTRGTKR